MVVKDFCIYCILPAVPTLPSTYFTSKVLVSWETFLVEIVIVIFPSLRRSFMFPSYPGNKPSDGEMELRSVFHPEPCEVGACFS